ncbi:hypothetical protein WR25_21617 [Diploscapter pachys]|uniref:F-box domain-containing protein n=1 Tax=Diploscapter pachys TaxID=2018661 RepID=A0A2A2LXE2_9BILA|nr:hypothetical protein WR25_21617 [Diploscapter pachys]
MSSSSVLSPSVKLSILIKSAMSSSQTNQPALHLCDLPNDVLINVFSKASTGDVLAVKQANKQLHRVVEQYNLGRPSVDEFSVEMRTNCKRVAPIGRIQMKPAKESGRRIVVTMKRKGKVKQIVEETEYEQGPSRAINHQLRKIESTSKLSFDGICINSEFVQGLLSKLNRLRSVVSVTLTLCRIDLEESEWVKFLSSMPIESLSLDFCTINSSLISDKTLLPLSSLRSLRIQPRGLIHLPLLTDSLLHHWTGRHSNDFVHTLHLYNCTTEISTEGILEFLQVLPPNIKGDFDFGRIHPEAQNEGHLMRLLLSCGSWMNVKDDWRSRRVEIKTPIKAIAFNLVGIEPPASQ